MPHYENAYITGTITNSILHSEMCRTSIFKSGLFWEQNRKRDGKRSAGKFRGWVKGESFFPHSRFFVLLHYFASLLLLTNNSVSGVIQSSSTRSTCHSIHLISSVQFLNYYPAAVLCFSRNSMTSPSTSIILLLLSYLFELLNSPSLSWPIYLPWRCAELCQHTTPSFSTK